MEQHISPESLRLIADLINDKNNDLKDHFANEIRMVKTTVQENHNLAVESRDLIKITNGRVNKLEDGFYGELDKNGKIIKGREGLLFDMEKIKKWHWLYSDWRVIASIFILTTAVYIKESRDFMIKIIDKIL